MTTVLIFVIGIVGLGIMVFIHELGHFIAAKANGIGVEVFSLGWGKKLVGFTRGGTTYQISWFPVGGYCKMKGEEYFKKAQMEGSTDFPHEKGSLYGAPPWRRIVISAAGPIFNLVFAVLILTMIWWIGYRFASPDNRIVLATDYTLQTFSQTPPAKIAGLMTGDRIIAINGASVESYNDVQDAVAWSAGRRIDFTVVRRTPEGARTMDIAVTPVLDPETGGGAIGIYGWIDPVIETVVGGSPAAFAGLEKGDRILEANGTGIQNSYDLSQLLSSWPSQVTLAFERSGSRKTVAIVPRVLENGGTPKLGITWAIPVFHTPKMGLGRAAGKSVTDALNTISLTFKGIGLLITRKINVQNALAGPIRITYYIGDVATSGFQLGFGPGVSGFFQFLSFLSVVLFLMNLLPIPATDGGQILLFLYEVVRGKPVRPRTIGRIQYVGFSVLIVLILFITFSDIMYLLGR
jgi:regulator of sigma E protease